MRSVIESPTASPATVPPTVNALVVHVIATLLTLPPPTVPVPFATAHVCEIGDVGLTTVTVYDWPLATGVANVKLPLAEPCWAFEFVLDSELKRAVRSQNYLTLVTVEASREWEGMTVTADDGTLQEVAQLIGREVRDTDLIGHTDRGTLEHSGDARTRFRSGDALNRS